MRWLARLLVFLALTSCACAQTWLPLSSVPAPTVWMDFAGNYSTGCSGAFTNCLSVTNDGHGTATTLNGTVVPFATPNTLRITDQGLLIEEARTNVTLWNRDLTNAAWTKTTATAALDQTGADGTANSASSLLATGGNATCLQAITLGSSARFQTTYVKRLIGSGVVNMTMDNGATWTAITLTTNWTRVSIPTQALANPTVGFQIVTNGDEIAVDYVQNENGMFQTSAIPTTTVAVTRAADNVTGPTTWYNNKGGSVLTDFISAPVINASGVWSINDNSGNNRIDARSNNGGILTSFISIGGVSQSTLFIGSATISIPVHSIVNFKSASETAIANGTSSSASPAGLPTIITALKLGQLDSGGNYLNNYIRRWAYTPVFGAFQ